MVTKMRTREEVQKEIIWREEKIKELQIEIKQFTEEQDIEYNRYRISNLTFAIEWCRWFLNE